MNGRKKVTQVPVMIELLKMSGHQGADIMMHELTNGFEMTGHLQPGEGWLPRVDGRYSSPTSREEFCALNKAYVTDKLRKAVPSEHWETMLQELQDEVFKGRAEGLLQAPPDWGVTLPETEAGEPSRPPTTRAWAAMCFAVVQSDKVRRCEDYRRSFHNSTIQASDTPHYGDVEGYVATIQHLQSGGFTDVQIWGQDLAGAYRQIPVKPSEDPYTILIVPKGPTLWRHRATPFGAVASVWAFCRFGDCLTSLARRLLMVLTGHFVDDWTGIEPTATADSSCWAFKQFFEHLGLSMKPEKEQAPSSCQKVLGVVIRVAQDRVTVEICPQRKRKILQTLAEILANNRLTADESQRLAGKLGFMATSLFGGIGKAAIQPFYARAHGLGDQQNDKVTFAIRAAIHTLQQLLVDSRPRTFPMWQTATNPQAVIYSDAFFQLGEKMMRAKDSPELWSPAKRKPKTNGWGFVVRTEDRVTFAHGILPDDFVTKFTTRRAFIYMMEVMAAVIAVTFSMDALPPFFTMFIDNQAGKCALQKGYGKDCRVNAIITAFWTLASHHGWFPSFQYVKSELNISDKISRHDVAFAHEAGWEEVEIDLTQFMDILERFATDPNGSIRSLLQGLLTLERTPCRTGGVHGVVKTVHHLQPLQIQHHRRAEGGQKEELSAHRFRDASMTDTCHHEPLDLG